VSPMSTPAPTTTTTPALQHAFLAVLGDGKSLLGAFLEVSGLNLEYHTYDYEEGGNNQFVWKLRGRLKHGNVTLKSGVTDSTVLFDWATGKGSLQGPQNLLLRFTSPNGATLRTFSLASAVPVRWTGPNADIGSSAVATETLEIAHHGLLGAQ
jgi:phage tail-like protein